MAASQPFGFSCKGGLNTNISEIEMLKHLMAQFDTIHRISDERIVSGRGIHAVYGFMRKRFPEMVDAELDAAIEEMPEDTGLQMMKFQTMIGPMNDGEGYDLGWKLLKRNRDDAMMLNSIAWYTLDDPTVGDRDFEFAMAVAKAANTAAGGNNPAILDTLARAYYEQGDLDMAIKIQRKAVEKSDGGPMAEGIKTQLQKYRDEASSGRKAG